MKTRVCLATAVTESDSFLALSLEAQCAYLHLCADSRPTGQIIGVTRVLRGYGFGADVLEELLDGGFLLDVDGDVFVTHTWINNRYDGKIFKQMEGCEAYQCGRLTFAGATGRSAYRLCDDSPSIERRLCDDSPSIERRLCDDSPSIERRLCDDVSSQNRTEKNRTDENGSGIDENGSELDKMRTESEAGKANRECLCLCQRCGSRATYTTQDGTTTIHCATCGEYEYVR